MASFNIRLISDDGLDVTIDASSDQTIFDSAENQGVDLPISCRSGSCSTCAGKVVSGEIDQFDQVFLEDEQLRAEFILTCVAYPLSDCTIKIHQEDHIYG